MDQLFLLYKSQCVLNMLNQCIIIHIIQAFTIFPIAHDVREHFNFLLLEKLKKTLICQMVLAWKYFISWQIPVSQ